MSWAYWPVQSGLLVHVDCTQDFFYFSSAGIVVPKMDSDEPDRAIWGKP